MYILYPSWEVEFHSDQSMSFGEKEAGVAG